MLALRMKQLLSNFEADHVDARCPWHTIGDTGFDATANAAAIV
jgi:hypothetical protein